MHFSFLSVHPISQSPECIKLCNNVSALTTSIQPNGQQKKIRPFDWLSLTLPSPESTRLTPSRRKSRHTPSHPSDVAPPCSRVVGKTTDGHGSCLWSSLKTFFSSSLESNPIPPSTLYPTLSQFCVCVCSTHFYHGGEKEIEENALKTFFFCHKFCVGQEGFVILSLTKNTVFVWP